MSPIPASGTPPSPAAQRIRISARPRQGLRQGLLLAVMIAGASLLGSLCGVFEVPAWGYGLIALGAGYLLAAGPGAVVPVGIITSLVCFLLVRDRIWPQAWGPVSPVQDPQGWAAVCVVVWLGMLATVAALGSLARKPSASSSPWMRLSLASLFCAALLVGRLAWH